MDIVSLTIGDIVPKLYIDYNGLGSGVCKGDASDYHDRFGHVVAALFLTNWPKKYPALSAPVVFSTRTLSAEQIAELFQRMTIRCTSQDIKYRRILYKNTLSQEVIADIQNEISSQFPEKRCRINFPDPNGEKLSKSEALSWVFLFAIEDLHVFAKLAIEQNKNIPNIGPAGEKLDIYPLFEDFKKRVARLMYYMAANPQALEDTKKERDRIMKNCLEMMGLDAEDEEMKFSIGQYLRDEELSCFYDTFIAAVERLDMRGISEFGKSFSAMTMAELNTIPVEYFLPEEDIPFDLRLEGEPYETTDRWLGIAKYETARDLYLIEQILPPHPPLAV